MRICWLLAANARSLGPLGGLPDPGVGFPSAVSVRRLLAGKQRPFAQKTPQRVSRKLEENRESNRMEPDKTDIWYKPDMSIIGIDPGLHGAIAIFDVLADALQIYDVPIGPIKSNGKKRLQVDLVQLSAIIARIEKPAVAVIENVHSMPRQGVASSFKFGFVAGCLQQAIASAGIPMVLVEPRVWKRRFSLSCDKKMSRVRAGELLPSHRSLWPLIKHDGRAEAALIALYGARYMSFKL